MPSNEKTHRTKSIVFDALNIDGFDTVTTIGASVANTVVQAYMPVVQRSKVYKVVVNYSSITGVASFNIVVGTVAENAALVPTTDVVATAGQMMFPVDQVLTNAANVPQIFVLGNINNAAIGVTGSNCDAIYDTGSLLTLRAVTAGGGAIANLKVQLLMKPIDPGPSYTGVAFS